MDWHQPWMLTLDAQELEQLHDDCRSREKLHLAGGRYGLARAWAGLAHETVERMLEIERVTDELNPKIDQLVLEDSSPARGAYDWPSRLVDPGQKA